MKCADTRLQCKLVPVLCTNSSQMLLAGPLGGHLVSYRGPLQLWCADSANAHHGSADTGCLQRPIVLLGNSPLPPRGLPRRNIRTFCFHSPSATQLQACLQTVLAAEALPTGADSTKGDLPSRDLRSGQPHKPHECLY